MQKMLSILGLLVCMLVTLLQHTQGQITENLRLVDNVGKTGGSSGRLEIHINGQWGTVCDNGFSTADAEVACRILAYNSYITFGRVGELGFSPGTTFQNIWLNNLRCLGTEDSLNSCSHSGVGNHDCTHGQDVGLKCGGEGSLRLQDGSRTHGRLEIYHSGQWGTICDDDFDGPDADVACRQLGFNEGYCWGTAVEQFSISQVSDTAPIWLDDLRCGSNDTTLLGCSHNELGVTDCTHLEDVGVSCAPQNCDGNDMSYIYYYMFGGIVVGILISIFIFYLICRACPNNRHPPRPPPLPRTHAHSQTHPLSRTSGTDVTRNVTSQHRDSRHVPTKTTWITQAPPDYLMVVGSPVYKLEKSLRPSITVPPSRPSITLAPSRPPITLPRPSITPSITLPRPSITLPPFREQEEQDFELPPYPTDMDDLDTFPLIF